MESASRPGEVERKFGADVGRLYPAIAQCGITEDDRITCSESVNRYSMDFTSCIHSVGAADSPR